MHAGFFGSSSDQPELVQGLQQANPGIRMDMRSNLLLHFLLISEIIHIVKTIAVECFSETC